MNSIVNYFLESGISLLTFTLFFLLALRQEKSFAFNRFYILGSVTLSIVIPFIHFNWAAAPSGLTAATMLLANLEIASGVTHQKLLYSNFFIWIYAIIAIALLARLILKSTQLIWQSRSSVSRNGYRQLVIKNSSDAFTFWNTVFVGDQLSQSEQELILRHERIHAKEKHSFDILFLEILSAVFWINPVFLVLKKLARINHEYLADLHALNESSKDDYIKVLAEYTLKKHGFTVAHQFYNSSMLERIKMINKQNAKIMKIKQVLPFAIACLLVVSLGCEDAQHQIEQDGISSDKTSSEYTVQDGIYDKVEVPPSPEGGLPEFYAWIAQHLKYPTKARKEGIEGKVFVEFVLDESGRVTNVKAIKGIGAGCDRAAVDLIKQAAPWTPGMIDGQAVAVRMVLPISFKIR